MLTDEEIEAIRFYSSPRFALINSYLRGEEEIEEALFPLVGVLDGAIRKSILTTEMTFFRGVNGDAASYFRRMNFGPGDIFTDAAFASVSVDPGIARLFSSWPPGGLILEIRVQSGRSALDISRFSECPDEKEFLLERDLPLRVVSFEPGSSLMRVEAV